jgi:hypothetical protein
MRTFLKILALSAVGASLGACVYDDYGYGRPYYGAGYYGSPYGYSPYGYGRSGVSVSIGYGSGYGGYGYGSPYYGGYGSPYYGGYGYGSPYYGGYGAPYYGWYNNYYYPGTGIYVYDSNRRPHRWSDEQRRYWGDRKSKYQSSGQPAATRAVQENWSGFNRDSARAERRADRLQSRPRNSSLDATQSTSSSDSTSSRSDRHRNRPRD